MKKICWYESSLSIAGQKKPKISLSYMIFLNMLHGACLLGLRKELADGSHNIASTELI
jgi:hypothetical protein